MENMFVLVKFLIPQHLLCLQDKSSRKACGLWSILDVLMRYFVARTVIKYFLVFLYSGQSGQKNKIVVLGSGKEVGTIELTLGGEETTKE